MQTAERELRARWVVPVRPEGAVLEHASVFIDQGQIVAVTTDPRGEGWTAPDVIDYPEHALIPGLVNAHTHAPMGLFRGLADDLPLMTWLQEHIWPAEARHVNERFVRVGTELAVTEMLLGGTTCFNDMYFFPDVTSEVVEQAGMRATVGLIVIDAPTVWAQDLDDYLARATAVHDQLRHSSRVRTAFAPHAPYTVSDEGLRRIGVLAHELDIPVHIHLHETQFEVDDAVSRTGQRPIERLADLGLLSPRLVAVHMTALDEGDIERVSEHGVHVVHCPESNMKLASGTSPVGELMARGVNVALGTDGAASNNDLDMFAETRSAALLAKAVSGDPTQLPAPRALTMATLGGAMALGRGDELGSIEVGKQADLAAVHLARPSTWPVHHVISTLVYAATRDAVTDVWVGGEAVVRDGTVVHLRTAQVLEDAEAIAAAVRKSDRA